MPPRAQFDNFGYGADNLGASITEVGRSYATSLPTLQTLAWRPYLCSTVRWFFSMCIYDTMRIGRSLYITTE